MIEKALRRANATLAAFDEALELSARQLTRGDHLPPLADIDVQHALPEFEREYSSAVAQGTAARRELEDILALGRDWGERANEAERQGRLDLSDQARHRQHELQTYARHLEADLKIWEEILRTYESTLEQLRARLRVSARDVLPN